MSRVTVQYPFEVMVEQALTCRHFEERDIDRDFKKCDKR